MNIDVRNGLVAGVIAGVIAFLAWTFLAEASVGAALGIAALFFVVTALIATFVARSIRTSRAPR